MKKKIIVFGFLALIAVTLGLGIFSAVESYRFDMDPASVIRALALGVFCVLIASLVEGRLKR